MMEEDSRKMVGQLRKRWLNETSRIAAICEDLKKGRDWTIRLVASEEHGWKELALIETCPTPRLESEAAPRDLRGIAITGFDLSKTEGLADSCLDYAVFESVNLSDASLVGASLRCVQVGEGSILDGANLTMANLERFVCRDVSLADANLTRATLVGGDFEGADLRECLMRDVTFNAEGVFGFLHRRNWTRFGGSLQSPRHLDRLSSHDICRYIAGEVARYSLRLNHRGVSNIAYLLSNYGRSAGRLFFWIGLVWWVFGAIYAGFPLPKSLYGSHVGHILSLVAPKIHATGCTAYCGNWFAPFYFSLVTLTTLGNGDVAPYPDDWRGQMLVCIEVLFGYIFMAGFVSLLIQNSVSLPHEAEMPSGARKTGAELATEKAATHSGRKATRQE